MSGERGDAERYRWLRAMWWNFSTNSVYPTPAKIGGTEFWRRLDAVSYADSPEALDAAIDAAIVENPKS